MTERLYSNQPVVVVERDRSPNESHKGSTSCSFKDRCTEQLRGNYTGNCFSEALD